MFTPIEMAIFIKEKITAIGKSEVMVNGIIHHEADLNKEPLKI